MTSVSHAFGGTLGILCMVAYLLGSIPSGLVVGRIFTGRDVRHVGSGNIGAANVSRLAGRRAAIIVLVLDVAKGAIPVLIARGIGFGPPKLALVAGLAVVGHDFSLFLRFKGGKGVATTLGVAVALMPVVALIAALGWIITAAIWRHSSLASLVSLWLLPMLVAGFDGPVSYVLLTVALLILAVIAHRGNLWRLAKGSERRIGDKTVA